jgi:hypothetical protein
MNRRHLAVCGFLCAVLALTGCDEGRKAPGKVTVRVANAAPSLAVLAYSREQPRTEQPTQLQFRGASEFVYDADTYDFFAFERSLSETYTPRTWTFNRELQADRGYTFVLAEAGGEVRPLVVEYAAAPATEAQFAAVHSAAGLPAMDLYLERQGVGIAGATPRGTFNPLEQIAPRTIAAADYELFLTAAGDPANVLLASSAFNLPAGVTSTFVLIPETGYGPTALSVLLVQPGATILYDRNATSQLRVVNGATDTAPRDFALASQFSPPVFSAIPFAEPTDYTTIANPAQTINVTPVGNPGVLELNQQLTGIALNRLTLLFGGTAGTLTHAIAFDDGRRIANEAKILFLNAATQFTGVEFLVLPRSADPVNALAYTTLLAPGAPTGYGELPPGDYDLYLRDAATAALLSGPTQITVAAGGIYGALAINGADTATAGVVLFDDFP